MLGMIFTLAGIFAYVVWKHAGPPPAIPASGITHHGTEAGAAPGGERPPPPAGS